MSETQQKNGDAKRDFDVIAEIIRKRQPLIKQAAGPDCGQRTVNAKIDDVLLSIEVEDGYWGFVATMEFDKDTGELTSISAWE